MTAMVRSRWAAMGAAVAVTLGAGGIGLVSATSPSDATAFVPVTPCRVLDTRPAPNTVGPRSAPLAAGDTHTVTVHGDNGDCTGIPSSAAGVQLNVTAVGASAATFLTIWEAGQTRPDASSLNPSPGQPPTPNAVTTSVNGSGQFNVFNKFGTVDVLADITGYYVDHHHDDRYYRKSQTYTTGQVDAAIESAAPKMIQLPVSSASVGFNAFYSTNNGRAGIRVPNATSNAGFGFDFVLPSDYTADSTITFELLWYIDEANCTVGFQRSSSTLVRAGSPRQAGDIEGTLKLSPSGGVEIVNSVTFDWIPDGIGAQPGDGIHVSFYRTNDSCSNTAIVQSVSATYD